VHRSIKAATIIRSHPFYITSNLNTVILEASPLTTCAAHSYRPEHLRGHCKKEREQSPARYSPDGLQGRSRKQRWRYTRLWGKRSRWCRWSTLPVASFSDVAAQTRAPTLADSIVVLETETDLIEAGSKSLFESPVTYMGRLQNDFLMRSCRSLRRAATKGALLILHMRAGKQSLRIKQLPLKKPVKPR
jgi:hypothetical protein